MLISRPIHRAMELLNRLRIEFMATDITSPQVPHTTMERGENIVLTVDGINNCRDNHSS